ncbi:Trypsin epsilon [Smittium mucronatum]|uniref:Trypsin epsilon n=1 Tax=Smittium mucronatum TaxID=133383 RepID=A0A1R0H8N3_9FUNG|nr:Trypsin epsilon [Smittium mucronatum]
MLRLLIACVGLSYLGIWVKAQSNSTFNAIDLKVINGVQVQTGTFSYAAFIYSDYGNEGSACTGSLIAPNVVVTAAHCLFDEDIETNPSQITVSVGSIYNIKYNTDIYSVSKSIPHPQYDADTAINDIGLLILSRNTDVKTFAKIYDSSITTDMKATVAGWGVTSNSNTSTVSDVLMSVPLEITESSQCKIYNPEYTNNNGGSICTATQDNQDSCYGDSGGPLALSSASGYPLLGLTSFGNGPSAALYANSGQRPPCAVNGGFGYYTHLFYYIDWIASTASLSKSSLLYSSSNTTSSSSNSSTSSTNTLTSGASSVASRVSSITSTLSSSMSRTSVVSGSCVSKIIFALYALPFVIIPLLL